MKRTVPVARTAHDLTHVNRLRTATFGVRELRLSLGGKTSRAHLADYAPPPPTEEKGSDGFHFAPKAEKAHIVYKLDDRAVQITKATLELFRRDKAEAVWKKELDDKGRAHGEHQLEWDGTIDKNAEFPEALITAEHSPYKLKLTIEGNGHSDSLVAWTYFHVLVHSFKLELGDKTVLTRAGDKKLWDELKAKAGSVQAAVPAAGSKEEIRLISNLFSVGNDKSNNSAFTTYKTLWDTGPHIPIFAKLLIQKSDGKDVEVPEAVGKVRIQWDFEDDPEDLSRHFTEAKAYLEASLDRHKATTKPKGDNCHKDHGGKRGDAGASVFPAQAGYAPADALTAGSFPFKVEKGGTRKWSSYSESWPTGKLKGMSGVLFEPARMAGDAYKLKVRFPYVRKPDGKDEFDTEDDNKLKDAVLYTAGTFQIWREVHIIKYRKKAATITSINLATVADYYEKSWMKMVDKTGGTIDGMPGYDALLRAKVNAQVGPRKYALEPGDQGTTTQAAAKYRSFADFGTAVKAGMGWNNAQFSTWVTNNIGANVSDYEDFLESITDAVVPKACDGYLSASEGINILQFNLYWETSDGLESGTNGFASTDFPSMGLTKAAYLQTRLNYGAGSKNNMQQTTTHEIGHILFLPHAPTAGGFVEALHDQKTHWNNCTMSYNYDKERKFCGLCLLRLRGWDQTNLDKDRTKNKKP